MRYYRVPHSSTFTLLQSRPLPLPTRSGPDSPAFSDTGHWSLALSFLSNRITHSLISQPDPVSRIHCEFLAGATVETCLALRCHMKQCGTEALDHNPHSFIWTRWKYLARGSGYIPWTFGIRPCPVHWSWTPDPPRRDDLLIASSDRIS